MPGRTKYAIPLSTCSFKSAKLAMRPEAFGTPLAPEIVDSIRAHLGGDEVFEFLHAYDFVVNHDHVSFMIAKPNPNGVRAVVISVQTRNRLKMDCYGWRRPDSFSAPLVGTAKEIVPENLATVLGKLTGVEELHHRHF